MATKLMNTQQLTRLGIETLVTEEKCVSSIFFQKHSLNIRT
jgi:hypothetical protein